MRCFRSATCMVAFAALFCCFPGSLLAEGIWTVGQGSTVVCLDLGRLEGLGLKVAWPGATGPTVGDARYTFAVDADSTLTFSVEGGSISEFLGGRILHPEGLSFIGKRGKVPLDNLIISQVRGATPATC